MDRSHGIRIACALAAALIPPAGLAAGPPAGMEAWLERSMPSLLGTYEHLHAHPELSYREAGTAHLLAERLRKAGFEVAEGVGRYREAGREAHGVVALLRNGKGPTVLVRTDLDALPVTEETGLPYASRVTTRDEQGNAVGVMHACGHDVHVTCLLGTAGFLAQARPLWSGTLVLVGQPAEERGAGARALLADGLYERFARPDFALALHCSPSLEAGAVGVCPGYALASVDSVDITIHGRGGHGALPQTTIDPVVTASRLVVALQTLVSRTVSPLDPAVVTVGSIHGGTKHNIIPDEVRLQLTVRCYREDVRRTLLEGIRRITRGVALSAGIAEGDATVVVHEEEHTDSTYNDPPLTDRLAGDLRRALGEERVRRVEPVMAGEDFGRYSLEGHAIPSCLVWLGAVPPDLLAEHREKGTPLPSLHSSRFAPEPEASIRTGITVLGAAVLDLLARE